MKFYAECMSCLMASSLKKAASVKDEALKLEYARRICDIFRETDPSVDTPPVVDAKIIRLRRELLQLEDDFSQASHSFNQLLLGVYSKLRARVNAAPDPLYAAIQLSMAGNYVDFGVLKDVREDRLLEMLDEAAERKVDAGEYARLCEELDRPGEMVFIHDNCGEIVLDRLLIETILQLKPGQRILSVVRGAPVLNDATMADAEEVGLTSLVEVIGNGLPDVAGTELRLLPEKVRRRIEGAGLIIAKGQGNFETLTGSGLNVYFLFLSKCRGYTDWFGFERFSGILANDRRMQLPNRD